MYLDDDEVSTEFMKPKVMNKVGPHPPLEDLIYPIGVDEDGTAILTDSWQEYIHEK